MKGKPRPSPKRDGLLKIVREYEAEHGKSPVSTLDIADFALSRKMWDHHKSARVLCARELAAAMRMEMIEDKHGRPVRKRIAARRWFFDTKTGDKVQKMLWGDIDLVNRTFKSVSAAQRRGQIVGDCVQLDRDCAYWSSKHPNEEPIQPYFNFMNDVKEANLPKEYKPEEATSLAPANA